MGMCCKKKTLIELVSWSLTSLFSTNMAISETNTDWVKKCMEYEVEGSRPRGRPKRIWTEVVQVQKGCQARKLNRGDAMDHSRWKKLIKVG